MHIYQVCTVWAKNISKIHVIKPQSGARTLAVGGKGHLIHYEIKVRTFAWAKEESVLKKNCMPATSTIFIVGIGSFQALICRPIQSLCTELKNIFYSDFDFIPYRLCFGRGTATDESFFTNTQNKKKSD